MEKFKNLQARRSSSVEEVVSAILDEEAMEIHVGFPRWFTDAVGKKEFSDEECEAIVESVYDVLSDVLWETLTEELEKQRRAQQKD